MSKAQKALNRLGISIEDSTTGSLKPLDTILEEVGAKWNGLTDVEKQYTSEMLAGEMKVCACVYRNIYNRIILNKGHPNVKKDEGNLVLNYIEVILYIKAKRLFS